jgi:copper chaperone
METRTILVTGMSCDHCANAVRAELTGLPGVTEVGVDVEAGKVRVTASGEFPAEAALRAAIEEAGYELTS